MERGMPMAWGGDSSSRCLQSAALHPAVCFFLWNFHPCCQRGVMGSTWSKSKCTIPAMHCCNFHECTIYTNAQHVRPQFRKAANVLLDGQSNVSFSDKITFVIKVEDGALGFLRGSTEATDKWGSVTNWQQPSPQSEGRISRPSVRSSLVARAADREIELRSCVGSSREKSWREHSVPHKKYKFF